MGNPSKTVYKLIYRFEYESFTEQKKATLWRPKCNVKCNYDLKTAYLSAYGRMNLTSIKTSYLKLSKKKTKKKTVLHLITYY